MRRYTSDRRVLGLVKAILKAPIQESNGVLRRPKSGCPQGGPLSPLLANAYLDVLDQWFLENVRYRDAVLLRYCDDAILVSRTPVAQLHRRISQKLQSMGLALHPDKTREVDMGRNGAHVDFLGYRFARRKARNGKALALLMYPRAKAMNAFRRRMRELLPSRGPPISQERVRKTNAVIRGWVQYFARSTCKAPFRALDRFTKARVRRLLVRPRKIRGRGTRRYSDQWLTERLGLLSVYYVYVETRQQLKAVGRMGRESPVR